jgi:hypothetical protein
MPSAGALAPEGWEVALRMGSLGAGSSIVKLTRDGRRKGIGLAGRPRCPSNFEGGEVMDLLSSGRESLTWDGIEAPAAAHGTRNAFFMG